MKQQHLNHEERHYIEIEKKAGRSQSEIAIALGRSQSTISRELKRNTGKRGYRYKQADRFAQERHKSKAKSIKMTDEIKEKVNEYIREEWRPEVANQRQRIGDWEADTIIGKNHRGAIVTLDERKSKLRLALPLQRKQAQAVKEAMVTLLHPIREFVKTITFDNGKAFTQHESIAEALSCDTYFAQPYYSWERGQNENANGLLRQYFPKSMELIDIANRRVFRLSTSSTIDPENAWDSRPLMRCLETEL